MDYSKAAIRGYIWSYVHIEERVAGLNGEVPKNHGADMSSIMGCPCAVCNVRSCYKETIETCMALTNWIEQNSRL